MGEGNLEAKIKDWAVVVTMWGWEMLGIAMFTLAMIYGPAPIRGAAIFGALIEGALIWYAKNLMGGFKNLLLLQMQEE